MGVKKEGLFSTFMMKLQSLRRYDIRCLYEKNQFVLGQLRKYFSCEFTCQIMLQYSFPFRMNFLFAVEDKKRFPGDGFDSRLLDSKSIKSSGKASLADGKWHHHYHRFRIILSKSNSMAL